MFRFIQERISLKIILALIAVLVVMMAISTSVIIQRRAAALQQELLVKASSMAKVGAEAMEGYLEGLLNSGALLEAELFDTDYRKIESGPLAGSDIPKYRTDYDHLLDDTIRDFQDTFPATDDMVVFAALVDRNGYLPTHNSKYDQPLTGDPDKDRVTNRTKRIFNDPVGLAAARYDGSDGKGYLQQTYARDTGETMWDVSAPVFVRGEHWGAFRIGFSMKQAEAAIAELRSDVIVTMLLVLLLASVTIYAVVSVFIRPLKQLTTVANRMSEGQMEETLQIKSPDEIGQLAKAFNRMAQVLFKNLQGEVDKNRRMFGRVKETVQHLSTSANEMMAISTEQSTCATQQASAVQQATTTSEEIAVMARQVADNALRVESLAGRTQSASEGGTRATQKAIDGMNELKGQVGSIAEAMLELGEDSQKIGGIVEIIDEISDQTNLLSLNAAIEAAGAGEAGKRFSIVAGEVKRLATRTVEATKQIRSLIERIQKRTNANIMLTEQGIKGVDSAGTLVADVARELEDITRMVQETSEAASEIKFSTQEQTTACEQMALTVVEVRDVATQVASGAKETETALTDLLQLAESLRDLMEEDLQAKGKIAAESGAKVMERMLEQALAKGDLTREQLFDENYQPVKGTDPPKYTTSYDDYLDQNIRDLLDGYLQDDHVVFAVLVDRNGYLPTHNSKYARPLTGDPEHDRIHNRTKRIFDDKVGITAARNREEVLMQVYSRDTGEKMWDISSPVYLEGEHWGAFRIGYTMD